MNFKETRACHLGVIQAPVWCLRSIPRQLLTKGSLLGLYSVMIWHLPNYSVTLNTLQSF